MEFLNFLNNLEPVNSLHFFFIYLFNIIFYLIILQATRQQLERFPRRQAHSIFSSNAGSSSGGGGSGNNSNGTSSGTSGTQSQNIQHQSGLFVGGSVGCGGSGSGGGSNGNTINSRDAPILTSSMPLGSSSSNGIATSLNQSNQSQFLLARFMTPTLDEQQLTQLERDIADRFVFYK